MSITLTLLHIMGAGQDTKDYPEFIFVAGIYQFSFKGWEILTKQEAATISIELTESGYLIENDKAVVIRIPANGKSDSKRIQFFENDNLLFEREGFISRSNPNQFEFRLETAFDKVLILHD